MPTITVDRKVVERIIGKKLTEKELKDRISYLGTDLESIDSKEIHLEIFPNRPDMLSEHGFGRALSSFVGKDTGLRKYDVKKSGEKCFVSKDMKNVRPYTACCIVKNLKLDDSKIKEIIQVQEKLHVTFCRKRKKAAIGIYPCEKIKFPISLKCDKPENIKFQPLEFPREINARQILSQHPTGREYAHLVEGLSKFAYFADSNDQVLSFTPIINSHQTGKITENTKEAFIEVSGFDLRICKNVLNILVTAIADMGADIYSMDVVYSDKTITTPELSPTKMKVDLDYINKRLGLDLKEKNVKVLLERMGYGYEKGYALVPAYRADIIHQIDLAEDIAIAYGYENFKAEIPKTGTIGQEAGGEIQRRKISYLLAGLGLMEVSTYHLGSKEIETKMMNMKTKPIELANALTIDYNVLRASMLPSLMNVLKLNKTNEYPQKIFDIGKVFYKGKTDTGVVEERRLSAALAGKGFDYTKIRQVLDYLLDNLDVKYEVKAAEHPSFIPGRCAKVVIDGTDVGFLGEISPEVISNFEIEMPVVGMEIKI